MNGFLFGLAGAALAYAMIGGLVSRVTFERAVAVTVTVSLFIGVVEVILQ